MMRISLAVLTAMLFAATAHAQEQKPEFLKYGDVISGQVRAVQRNGEPVYQVISDAPKPFAHKDACKAAAPKAFHLAETDNKAKTIRLKRSVGQKLGDVVCRGLAVDGGVKRQDHFFHRRFMRTRNQRVD
jgi:hypothetical protein